MLEEAGARQVQVACAGGQSPPKHCRAYSHFDKRVESIVQSYDAYQTAKINGYLKALGLAFAGNITVDMQHADDDDDDSNLADADADANTDDDSDDQASCVDGTVELPFIPCVPPQYHGNAKLALA